jgi:hypothetical protein
VYFSIPAGSAARGRVVLPCAAADELVAGALAVELLAGALVLELLAGALVLELLAGALVVVELADVLAAVDEELLLEPHAARARTTIGTMRTAGSLFTGSLLIGFREGTSMATVLALAWVPEGHMGL